MALARAGDTQWQRDGHRRNLTTSTFLATSALITRQSTSSIVVLLNGVRLLLYASLSCRHDAQLAQPRSTRGKNNCASFLDISFPTGMLTGQ
jgi:hypothetical protein